MPAGTQPSGTIYQGTLQSQGAAPKPSAELLAAGKKVQQVMADPEISPQQKETWLNQWSSSPEGLAFSIRLSNFRQSMYQNPGRRLSLAIAADGSFRLEDVPPGDYHLQILQMQRAGVGYQLNATIQRQITVPEHSDQPLDLGELTLVQGPSQAATTQPGAFSLEAKTLDGQNFKLADQRGKVVLLDLWATWAPPSDRRLAVLNDVYATLGQDKKFIMIGLGAGDSAAEVKQFAQQHPMPWLQASLDESTANMVAQTLRVGSLPVVVLIGPDGRMITTGLRGDGIKVAVQQALKNP
jgi:hypothetical protein